MRQNLKMAQPTAAPSDGTLTFNADGTFSTSKVDSKAEVTVPGTSTRATGQMKCASERDVVGGGRHAYAVHEPPSTRRAASRSRGPGACHAPSATQCRPTPDDAQEHHDEHDARVP